MVSAVSNVFYWRIATICGSPSWFWHLEARSRSARHALRSAAATFENDRNRLAALLIVGIHRKITPHTPRTTPKCLLRLSATPPVGKQENEWTNFTRLDFVYSMDYDCLMLTQSIPTVFDCWRPFSTSADWSGVPAWYPCVRRIF